MITSSQDRNPNEVRIDAKVELHQGAWVDLDPPRPRIHPGCDVVWSFIGIPEGYRPAVRFLSFHPHADERSSFVDPLRGPFSSLVRQGSEIIGSGRRAAMGEDAFGEYSYKVCLVPVDEGDALVIELECRRVPHGGLVDDPGPAHGGGSGA